MHGHRTTGPMPSQRLAQWLKIWSLAVQWHWTAGLAHRNADLVNLNRVKHVFAPLWKNRVVPCPAHRTACLVTFIVEDRIFLPLWKNVVVPLSGTLYSWSGAHRTTRCQGRARSTEQAQDSVRTTTGQAVRGLPDGCTESPKPPLQAMLTLKYFPKHI
jgi:hypothetical protein